MHTLGPTPWTLQIQRSSVLRHTLAEPPMNYGTENKHLYKPLSLTSHACNIVNGHMTIFCNMYKFCNITPNATDVASTLHDRAGLSGAVGATEVVRNRSTGVPETENLRMDP